MDLVITCLTQRVWVLDSHQPPKSLWASGFQVLHCKNLKNKFHEQQEGRKEFCYKTDCKKRKHAEAPHRQRGTQE